MSNIESNIPAVMNNENIQSFGKIMNIMQHELNTRNLEYLELQNMAAQDDGRIVFDIQTLDARSGKIYVVHVDFMQSAPSLYQFMDCVYGSGSTSDLKILIYDSDNLTDDSTTHAKFYYVTRLINKCNAVSIPFEIIDYRNPLERSDLSGHWSMENPETVKRFITAGPLPAKRDILRMAFWAIFYNIYSDSKYSELHELHPDRSFEICILGNLCIFVRWTDSGIYYVISDNHGSEYISWLWENKISRLEKYADSMLSTYRDGVNSCICFQVNPTPIQNLPEMTWRDLYRLGAELHEGASNLKTTVSDAWRWYEFETKQIKDISVQ